MKRTMIYIFIKTLLIVALIIAAIGMPNEYYIFMRFSILLSMAILAFIIYKYNNDFEHGLDIVACGIIAFLYNPIASATHIEWIYLDTLTVIGTIYWITQDIIRYKNQTV